MGLLQKALLGQLALGVLGAALLLVLGLPWEALGFAGGLGVALLELLLLLVSARLLTGARARSLALMLPFSLAKFAVLGGAVWGLLVLARLPLLPVLGGFSAGLVLLVLTQLMQPKARGDHEQAD